MIRFILLALLVLLLARAFWVVTDGIIEAAGGTPKRGRRKSAVKLERDPVCGTYVAPARALTLNADGSTHYFCSEKCRDVFAMTKRA